MESLAPRAQRLLACLGDPSRFRVVSALVGGERCVSDLAGEVGLSQSCTTRHLQALQRERMVRRTREGKRVFFQICTDDALVRELVDLALRSAGQDSIPPPGERGRGRAIASPDGISDSPHSGTDLTAPDTSAETRRAAANPEPASAELDDYLL